MKVVIACDSFKGSLSAVEAGESLAAGICRIYPEAVTDILPVADGGEGTVDAFLYARKGRRYTAEVMGPLGNPVMAEYAMLDDGTAVIEMAAASGLPLMKGKTLDPMRATTYGTGQLMKAALDAGCQKMILGLGGSATNDAGAGMAQALGAVFLDKEGRQLGYGGGSLGELAMIDLSGLDPRIGKIQVIAAGDVRNPLCGREGASAVYGQQKGADMGMIRVLDQNLRHFAEVAAEQLGKEVQDMPGAGAAGGLGAGLLLFCNASMESGIKMLLDAVDFDSRIQDADLVITGEGQMDGQSVCGKVPVGVAKRVKGRRQIPVIAVTGSIGAGAEAVYRCGVDAIFSIEPGPMALEVAIEHGGELLCDTAERIMRFYRAVV